MTYNAVDDARLQKLLKRYIETHDNVDALSTVVRCLSISSCSSRS